MTNFTQVEIDALNQLGLLVKGPVTGVGAGAQLTTTGTGGRGWEILATGHSASQGQDKLNIRDLGNGQDVFTITSDGKVGIGTTSPPSTLSVNATGVAIEAIATNDTAVFAHSVTGRGVDARSSGDAAVHGESSSPAPAIEGINTGIADQSGDGVFGSCANTEVGGNAIHGQGGGNAGLFEGDVTVKQFGISAGDITADGTISSAHKQFVIDHPCDPENKFLCHSTVESPEMINIYAGNVITDEVGTATVLLPDYFEALNRDFRYQLTPIGQFAQAIVADEIANNRFVIKTDKPNVRVSWQVSGVRKDAYAKANPVVVEKDKSAAEKGSYLHPRLYGHPADKALMRFKPGLAA